MCTLDITPEEAAFERQFEMGRNNPFRWPKTEIFASRPGPFARGTADGKREAVIGQWGLIPWFAKSPGTDLQHQQCKVRKTVGQGHFQASVGAGSALQHPG